MPTCTRLATLPLSISRAKGDAWLFFGEIHENGCFFYENEWQDYLNDGTLNKISTAWSRDQEEKVYVQHKMKEHSKEIFDLLEKGAYFYVCGDARRMAKDVDAALQEIAEENGKDPKEYIKNLKDSKRYCRDVY